MVGDLGYSAPYPLVCDSAWDRCVATVANTAVPGCSSSIREGAAVLAPSSTGLAMCSQTGSVSMLLASVLPCHISHDLPFSLAWIAPSYDVDSLAWRASAISCAPGYTKPPSSMTCNASSQAWEAGHLCTFDAALLQIRSLTHEVAAGEVGRFAVADSSKFGFHGPGSTTPMAWQADGSRVASSFNYSSVDGTGVFEASFDVGQKAGVDIGFELGVDGHKLVAVNMTVVANLDTFGGAVSHDGKLLAPAGSPPTVIFGTTLNINITLKDAYGNPLCPHPAPSRCSAVLNRMEISMNDVVFTPQPVPDGPDGPMHGWAQVALPQADTEYQLVVQFNGVLVQGAPFPVQASSQAICKPGQRVSGTNCIECRASTYSESDTAAVCTDCAPGSAGPAGSPSWRECLCKPDFYVLGERERGERCEECPEGGVCLGNSSWPYAAHGFYSSSSPRYFIECGEDEEEAEARCLGHDLCGQEYADRLCSACRDGFYRAGEDCHGCGRVSGPGALAGGGFVIATFLCVLFWVLLSEQSIGQGEGRVHGQLARAPGLRGLIRWAAQWAMLLWREALLMVAETAAVLALVLIGLGEAYELAVLFVGLSVVVVFLGVRRAAAHNAAAADGRQVYSSVQSGGSAESSSSAESEVSLEVEHVEAAMKTSVIFLQTLATINEAFDEVKWTSWGQRLLRGAQRINVQISGLECYGISYAGQFYILLALVPCIWAVVCVAGLVTRVSSAPRRLGEGMWRLCAATVYFFAYPVAEACFAVFACIPEPIPNPEASYLAGAPWIKCGGHVQVQLAGVAAVALVVLMAIMGVMGWSVWQRGGVVPYGAVRFLTDGLEPERWWYEGAVMVRRLAFALVAAVLPRGSVFVAPMLLVLLLGGIVSCMAWRPYENRAALTMDVAQLVVSAFVVVSVQNLQETRDTGSIVGMTVLLTAAIGAVLGYMCVYVAHPIVTLVKGSRGKAGHNAGYDSL
ncbi:uncharacterized protein AMSG_11797 [Thecamonas trahens ATCC 50062]|uniref:Tyrosine-protein kinase ephrin type A/B receptor-like domain-containing protein n=1 Tax=Thecamonas trahens ATCC 50062 TaxID=461836 RepID=A0A0L0D778_THETB|nr:hypothetical protein AMSG_11797 [Thecamonas trahens ATCC 50062]KNC47946.1 hypothetical protein AMSG_11797 [Thecamonas trahens ATCC 50062]|eukprot:XP_013759115.1 hypothetical protein AMSG_11797 [Thecamonas trahens ATCC 50062]